MLIGPLQRHKFCLNYPIGGFLFLLDRCQVLYLSSSTTADSTNVKKVKQILFCIFFSIFSLHNGYFFRRINFSPSGDLHLLLETTKTLMFTLCFSPHFVGPTRFFLQYTKLTIVSIYVHLLMGIN